MMDGMCLVVSTFVGLAEAGGGETRLLKILKHTGETPLYVCYSNNHFPSFLGAAPSKPDALLVSHG